jgi:hypothetical protein
LEPGLSERRNSHYPTTATAPAVAKVSFVTKAADLGCGVGYYK